MAIQALRDHFQPSARPEVSELNARFARLEFLTCEKDRRIFNNQLLIDRVMNNSFDDEVGIDLKQSRIIKRIWIFEEEIK